MRLPSVLRPAAPSASTNAAAGPASSHSVFVPPVDALQGAVAALLVFGSTLVATPAPALALDGAKIGACLIQKCPCVRAASNPRAQGVLDPKAWKAPIRVSPSSRHSRVCRLPLARCVTDPSCAANLACIQTCTGRPDEGDCQVACGDKFSDNVVGDFTKCAVSDSKCVPQRGDDGSWPVPAADALVQEFTTEALEGPWYISAGLNKAFDTFDCQLHKFEAPTPTKLVGNLQVLASRAIFPRRALLVSVAPSVLPRSASFRACRACAHAERWRACVLGVCARAQWRIKDPIAGTRFVTRYTVQEFVQDKKQPGILYNHDNEFLHYQDDWYILAQKKNEYVVVYYRGNNDAWDGYGGAVVYSTAPTLDPKYFPEIDAALQKVGRKFSDFTLTDNSCKAAETRLEEIEADLVFVEGRVATGIQTAEQRLVQEIERDLKTVEREVEKDIQLIEREVVKDVNILEKDVEDEVGFLGNQLKGLFKR